ncbi:S1C family serine protease [Nocardia jejuensis]|uniref:S1C family serine protease n=1 Tax=Nocardia jejuensis TaxID=328049 RepID=UPI0008313DAE|nr:trypsin-like peptidase domain-containing protein [Nocardia jejuensis]
MAGFPGSSVGSAPRAHQRRVASLAAAAVVSAATLSLVACAPVSARIAGNPVAASPGAVTRPAGFTTAPDLHGAAQNVVSGLVDVNTELGMQNSEGAGTGIVLSSDGTVLTNNHVVEGATKIAVTDLGNGQTYGASVIGYDRKNDLAVLRLSGASDLQTAPLGDSDKVAVGDNVVGVGNAGGKGTPTAAAGQVTALNRSITASDDSAGAAEQLTGLIQVSANIQPGDSGGPLVNDAGQVVGMDTAASQGFRLGGGNQGFAIPIDKAVAEAATIRSGTTSGTVHIGDTAFLGVSVSDSGGRGAIIRGVVADGPADSLGLSAGDIVTALDDSAVATATDLTDAMDGHHGGETVTVHWTDRQGAGHAEAVRLTTGPVG